MVTPCYLPSEILTDIFLRLPLKSLRNAILVNKLCFQLISSPDFARARLKISKQGKETNFSDYRVLFRANPRLPLLEQFSLSFNSCSVNVVVDLDFPTNGCFMRVVGSCNGLLCIVEGNNLVYLWNPCTRKYRKLPRIIDDSTGVCQVTFGFGYDESTDDYKVVVLVDESLIRKKCHSSVFVWSKNRNSWKRIQDFEGSVRNCDMGVFVSGKVHWFSSFDHNWNLDIVSFDVGSEVFGIVQQPCYEEGFAAAFGVLGGCVCLLIRSYRRTCVDLLIMKEYGVKESWTKVATVSCVNIPDYYTDQGLVLPNGEILFWSYESFAVSNPKDDSFRFPGIKRGFFSLDPVIIHVQSLVSPIG